MLLTHPRSLGEPGGHADACRTAEGATTRAASSPYRSTLGGQVELTELTRLARHPGRDAVFDRAAGTARATDSAAARLATREAWSGKRSNRSGFPFRHRRPRSHQPEGLPGELCRHIDFDESGPRILLLSKNGLLFTSKIDGTEAQTLPRPLMGDDVAAFQQTLVGVAAALCWRRPTPNSLARALRLGVVPARSTSWIVGVRRDCSTTATCTPSSDFQDGTTSLDCGD